MNIKSLTKLLGVCWLLTILTFAGVFLFDSHEPVVSDFGNESFLSSAASNIAILIPVATILLTIYYLMVVSVDLALNLPGAFEMWRQTSDVARWRKLLPTIDRRERLRLVWSFFRGFHPFNFDAAQVRIGFENIAVDHRMAPLVERLNLQGVRTQASCQGWLCDEDRIISRRTGLHMGQIAYLKITESAEFPSEFFAAVVRSKTLLTIGNQTIKTISAYKHIEEIYAANEMFLALLADWVAGTIDASGQKYCELQSALTVQALIAAWPEGDRQQVENHAA